MTGSEAKSYGSGKKAVPGSRVLIVVDNLLAGGMQRQVVELLKGLKRGQRYNVTLAVLTAGGPLEEEARKHADEVLLVARKTRFDLRPLYAVAGVARRSRAEVIHVFGWMSGAAGLVAARRLRIPLINGSIRGAMPHLSWHERISRFCAKRSDVIVANSQAGLRAYGLTAHSRARVIRNGIDLDRFVGVVPCGRWTLCMVGNFGPFKDQATVIRAIASLRTRFPEVAAVLVGKPLNARDDVILARCRQLTTDLGMSESIRFVTDTDDARGWIAGSSFGVLMSRQGEGISNAILEYMALSKPVLATDCGGNTEVVLHGVTGYLVMADVPGDLASRLAELLASPEKAETMGREGRKVVESCFKLEQMCDHYEELYDQLLHKN